MSTKRAIYLRHSLIGVILLLCLIPACYGQDEHHFTFNAGAGVSPLVGDIHNRLSNGWHVTVGGGYQFMPYFETNLQFTYNGFGVQPRVLDELGVPDGNSHMWSLTVDPKLRLGGDRNVDPYIVGGVGYYRRTVEFTSLTVGQIVLVRSVLRYIFLNTGSVQTRYSVTLHGEVSGEAWVSDLM